MDAATALWAVFTSSFLAATLLPGGSELALYGALKLYPETRWTAIGVATLGNTLGALTSYAIGRAIPRTKPVKGLALLQRYGAPVLLVSWVPVIGDPLCVAAGWLRIHVAAATFFIAVGKFARYVAVSALAV
jgi:membrane protein YqaA with SNARE-associated domain